MAKDVKQRVDEDIAALFTTQGKFYGLEPAIAESEAIKRIQRNIVSLDEKTQKDPRLRLEEYKRFKELTEDERREVLRYAKEKAVPIPDAAHNYLTHAARN